MKSMSQSLLTGRDLSMYYVYVDDVYSIFFYILGEHLCHVQPNRDLKIKVLRCHKTKISGREMFQACLERITIEFDIRATVKRCQVRR